MPKKYDVQAISIQEKDVLLDNLPEHFTSLKADINGICVELVTTSKSFKEMWQDNFYSISESIRPHCRVIAMQHPGYGETAVLYEQSSKTVFLFNCGYYGYVKSLALAVAGDFMEDYHSVHSRFSVHGSLIDFHGRGIAIIAPSGSGKTTLSYGLLLEKRAKLVSDDWFYVQLTKTDVVGSASEKNNYIRDDIGDNWKIFKKLVDEADLDPQRRGVVDVSLAVGRMKTRKSTVVRDVVLLKRDEGDPESLRRLSPAQAVDFLLENDFCNPHQLVRSAYKHGLRTGFFHKMLAQVNTFILNTAHEGPRESRRRLLDIVSEDITSLIQTRKEASHKEKDGKLIQVTLEEDEGVIREIRIYGDFFIHPEESLSELETRLKGEKTCSIKKIIHGFFKKVKAYGISEESLVYTIEKALK